MFTRTKKHGNGKHIETSIFYLFQDDTIYMLYIFFHVSYDAHVFAKTRRRFGTILLSRSDGWFPFDSATNQRESDTYQWRF